MGIKFTDLAGGYNATSEVVLVNDLTANNTVTPYLRKRIQVLYAGVLAEALNRGKVDHKKAMEYIGIGGAVDHAKVRELVHIIRNVEHGHTETEEVAQTQLSSLDLVLWNQAADIVEQEHELIEGLGSRLASEVKEIGKQYTLFEAELNALPSLVARFS